jgi:hypothetical protein
MRWGSELRAGVGAHGPFVAALSAFGRFLDRDVCVLGFWEVGPFGIRPKCKGQVCMLLGKAEAEPQRQPHIT